MPARLMLALLLVSGCGGGEDADPAVIPAEDPIEPSPYTYEAQGGGAAVYDPDAIEAALDDFAREILTINGAPVLSAYETALAEGEGGCPAWYEVDGNVFWYADCTTPGGATFSGYGTRTVYTDVDLNGDGALWNGLSVYGSGVVITAEGDILELGGTAALATGVHPDGYNTFYSVVQGGFAWGGESADGTWLADGGSPTLTVYGVTAPAYDLRYVMLWGTVGGISAAASAVTTSTLLIGDELLGYPCDVEPAGELAIRDAQGAWWTVRFDVDPDTLALSGACDGCGGAYDAAGAYQGDVCMDATPLLNWSETPW